MAPAAYPKKPSHIILERKLKLKSNCYRVELVDVCSNVLLGWKLLTHGKRPIAKSIPKRPSVKIKFYVTEAHKREIKANSYQC